MAILDLPPIEDGAGPVLPDRAQKLHDTTGVWMDVFSAWVAENTRAIRRKNSLRTVHPTGLMAASDTYRVAQCHQFDDIGCVPV